uniref:NELL2-interacting cell ontogeny regulator 1 n=1 Tax=Apteryx owenii TaxID=8824 RepID=A0A8B9PDF9_APTOW
GLLGSDGARSTLTVPFHQAQLRNACRPAGSQEWGRPCVDCHAFEFMQRALQDLKKTAYNLDTRVCVSIEMFLLSLYLPVARSPCLCTADMTSLLTHFHFSK